MSDAGEAIVTLTIPSDSDELVVHMVERSDDGDSAAEYRVPSGRTAVDAKWWEREPCTGAWWADVEERVGRWVRGVETRLDRDELAAALSRLLLPRQVRDRLAELRAGVGDGGRLVVAVASTPGADRRLAGLPWELVQLAAEDPLAGPNVGVVRLVDRDDPAGVPLVGEGTLRAMVVVGPRRVGGGWAPATGAHDVLSAEFGHLEATSLLAPLDPVDIASLEEALAGFDGGDPLDLLVFDGHGEQTGLWFGTPGDGPPALVTTNSLAETLTGRVRVALLVACRAGSSPIEPPQWEGVGEALARSGVTTVGFATAVAANSAARFVEAFMAQLRAGRAVDAAARIACGQLAGDGAPHGRVAVWQGGPEPVSVRRPPATAATGPGLRTIEDRYGGQDWFVDRPELIADLAAAVASGARVIEVIGSPGAGKSSLLRWWFETAGDGRLSLPDCALLRDPVLTQRDSLSGRVLCARVAAAAASRTGRQAALRAELDRTRHLDERSLWSTVTLDELSRASDAHRTEPLLVLVDELDQADGLFVDVLGDAIATAPPWVVWVWTSRPDMRSLGRLRSGERVRVSLGDHRDTSAVSELARRLLAPLVDGVVIDEGRLGRLAAVIGGRADGVFLWKRVVCDLLVNSGGQPVFGDGDLVEGLRLPSVAAGNDLFVLFDEAFRGGAVPVWGEVAELVGLVVACRDAGGFSIDDLLAVSGGPSSGGLTAAGLSGRLGSAPLRQFLDTDGVRWRAFHQSFADWVRTAIPGAAVLGGEADATIGLALERLRRDDCLGGLGGYSVEHVVGHLVSALESLDGSHPSGPVVLEALAGVVGDDGWLVDAVTVRGPAAVAADVGAAGRWVDTGERGEVFLHTVKDAAVDPGSQRWLVTSVSHRAVEWGEAGLVEVTADYLDATGGDWWELQMRAGPRRRAGTAVNAAHHAAVHTVSWHPTRNLVASGDADGVLIVWDPDIGTINPIGHHDAWVTAVVWSPDGARLATSSRDGTVRVWDPGLSEGDPGQGRVVGRHDDEVTAVVWSPDGARLATGCADGTVRVWDPGLSEGDPGQGRVVGRHDDEVNAVVWSRDGVRLASGSRDGTVRVWDPGLSEGDPGQGRVVGRHDGEVNAVVWSPDGARLATGSRDGTVSVWDPGLSEGDPGQGRVVGRHDGTVWSGVWSVVWSPDGARLATSSRDGTVRVWDPGLSEGDPGQGRVVGRHDDEVTAVVWSPDGARLATAGRDRTVRVWDPDLSEDDPGQRRVVGRHDDEVNAVVWSPDGARLATGNGDGTVRVWDPGLSEGDPGQGRVVGRHDGTVSSVVWSPDGARLATGGWDGTVRVWDPNLSPDDAGQGRIVGRHDGTVWSVVWSPDGARLATSSRDGTVRVWDPGLSEGDPGQGRVVGRHDGEVTAVVWSPDGARLATGCADGTVRVWDPGLSDGDPDQGRIVGRHAGGVTAVVWSPDGARLATAGWDWMLRVSDPELAADDPGQGRIVGRHDGKVSSVAWSRDGARLATGGWDGTVRVWDPNLSADDAGQGRIVGRHDGKVLSVVWSPDGARLATGGRDGTLRVSDLELAADDPGQGRVVGRHDDEVSSVAWSRDGARLATAGRHATVRVWRERCPPIPSS